MYTLLLVLLLLFIFISISRLLLLPLPLLAYSLALRCRSYIYLVAWKIIIFFPSFYSLGFGFTFIVLRWLLCYGSATVRVLCVCFVSICWWVCEDLPRFLLKYVYSTARSPVWFAYFLLQSTLRLCGLLSIKYNKQVEQLIFLSLISISLVPYPRSVLALWQPIVSSQCLYCVRACVCIPIKNSTQFFCCSSLTMSNLRQLHKMIICISSLMSRSMAWVTIETAREIRWCCCRRWTVWLIFSCGSVVCVLLHTENDVHFECDICQITHNHLLLWMPNDGEQNRTKPTNEEKKAHTRTLSQNVTSTGMISIEIYGPRDLFIFFSFLASLSRVLFFAYSYTRAVTMCWFHFGFEYFGFGFI